MIKEILNNETFVSVRNEDHIGDDELLVISFGTSYQKSCQLNITAIEDELEKAFPQFSVRRGFTSQIIVDVLRKRDHIYIDHLTEALVRAKKNHVRHLVIQPTHLMDGIEYHDIIDELKKYTDDFEKVVLGQPLLKTDDDFKKVIDAVVTATAAYDDGETAICLMGHGTEAASNYVYEKMQKMMDALGHMHYYVGTVEATPTIEHLIEAVKMKDYKRIILRPLMIVAGDHANNDMASDDEDSWKSTFQKMGYEVLCVMEGLGELQEIRALFVAHAQAAIDQVK